MVGGGDGIGCTAGGRGALVGSMLGTEGLTGGVGAEGTTGVAAAGAKGLGASRRVIGGGTLGRNGGAGGVGAREMGEIGRVGS